MYKSLKRNFPITYNEKTTYDIKDNVSRLSITEEESGCIINYTRDYSGDWEALYVPFAIDYDVVKEDFDLAEIYGVVQHDIDKDGTIDVTVLCVIGFKGMTMPNTPYLIRAKNKGNQTIVLDDATICPTEQVTFDCSSFSTIYEFTGTYKKMSQMELITNADRMYTVTDGVLQKINLFKGVGAMRWYMIATPRNSASLNLPNSIGIMYIEDVITGVEQIGQPTTDNGQQSIYNLAGQRLNKMQKGINIVGGKKVMVK